MSFEGESIAKRMAEANVVFQPTTWVRSIGDSDVQTIDVHSDRESVITDVDAVVLATGRIPVDGIARELDGQIAQLFTIGDALGCEAVGHRGLRRSKICAADRRT